MTEMIDRVGIIVVVVDNTNWEIVTLDERVRVQMSHNGDIPLNQQLAIYKNAVKHRWDVPAKVRAKVVEKLNEIVENVNGEYKPKDIVSASKTLADIVHQQASTDIAVTNLEMRIEEHRTLRTFESSLTSDFATGPKVLSYVDDTPQESEPDPVIDVEVEDAPQNL
jgi:hypothetical protein